MAAQQVPKAWAAYEDLDFAGASAAALALSGRGNQYLEQQAPWTSLKVRQAFLRQPNLRVMSRSAVQD